MSQIKKTLFITLGLLIGIASVYFSNLSHSLIYLPTFITVSSVLLLLALGWISVRQKNQINISMSKMVKSSQSTTSKLGHDSTTIDNKADGLNVLSSSLLNLWKGNLSLVTSFWFFYVIGNRVFGYIIDHTIEFPLGIRWYDLFANIVLVFTAVPFFFLTYVGTSRSANKYKGAKIWPIIVKVILIFGLIQCGLKLLSFVYF
jgi:hypothetical protein